MDINGGNNPLPGGYAADQPAVPMQPQFQQQAPMVSSQNAYVQPGGIAQPQSPMMTQPQAPIQDVRPGWQQDLQYSVPQDPPWENAPPVQYQEAPVQNSPLSSFDSFQNAPAQPAGPSSDAYSLLAEPFTDIGQTPASAPKKPIFIVLMVLVFLMVSAGMGAFGFNMGYQKGVTDTKSKQEIPATTNQEEKETSEESTEEEEPELSFELTKPDFAAETLTGSLGEQLTASDGLVINAYKIDTEYVPESADTDSEGSFVKVDLLLGNADDSRTKTITTSVFKLLDESGEALEPLDALSDGLGATGSVSLSPGMKARMSIVYAISTEGTAFQLTRTQPYQVGGQTRDVSLTIDLSEAKSAGADETSSVNTFEE